MYLYHMLTRDDQLYRQDDTLYTQYLNINVLTKQFNFGPFQKDILPFEFTGVV